MLLLGTTTRRLLLRASPKSCVRACCTLLVPDIVSSILQVLARLRISCRYLVVLVGSTTPARHAFAELLGVPELPERPRVAEVLPLTNLLARR